MRKVIIDTETTGLSSNVDKIIEIAMLEIDENNRLTGNFFHSYVNPQRSIPRIASRINGITWHRIKNAKIFAEIKNDVKKFIQDKEIISYYLPFNLEILKVELGEELPNKTTNILQFIRKKYPEDKTTLSAIRKHFKIKRTNFSDIPLLEDCYTVRQLYERCLTRSD